MTFVFIRCLDWVCVMLDREICHLAVGLRSLDKNKRNKDRRLAGKKPLVGRRMGGRKSNLGVWGGRGSGSMAGKGGKQHLTRSGREVGKERG